MSQKIAAQLAPRPSLDHLKHQAKHLLKEARAGNPHALSRLARAQGPTRASTRSAAWRLADAQLAIARENGSATWSELRRALADAGAPAPAIAAPAIAIDGISQIWLDCTDLAATTKFYGEQLGLRQTGAVPGGMVFFDCGGTSLLLGARTEIRPNSILYFRVAGSVDAIQQAYNKLKAAGVSVGDSPHCIARNWQGVDVWLAFFTDPSGNQLAFKADVPVAP